jgi:hypothetical protein
MVNNGYTYLPIVRKNGHLEGMLSLRELLEHRIDHLAAELDALPPATAEEQVALFERLMGADLAYFHRRAGVPARCVRRSFALDQRRLRCSE